MHEFNDLAIGSRPQRRWTFGALPHGGKSEVKSGRREKRTEWMAMTSMLRGAIFVARLAERRSVAHACSRWSGNHIMSILDAASEGGARYVHVRHEAAAVHMGRRAWPADRGCRHRAGHGGPGHANARRARCHGSRARSRRMVLLAGQRRGAMGRGGFRSCGRTRWPPRYTKA